MYIQRHSIRFVFLFLIFVIFLIIFAIRLVFLQLFNRDHFLRLARQQHSHVIELEAKRGGIYDRKLRPFALNVPAYSLYASPRTMTDEQRNKAVIELPRIVKLSKDFLQDKLDRDKDFIWVMRKLSFEDAERISQLKIKGLNFIQESKRNYPSKTLASQVIGFAGMDNKGLEGIELKYDETLKGKPGRVHVLRDARQQDLLIEKELVLPVHGFDIILTIDQTIQYIAERVMDRAFLKHRAKAASLVLMDPKTGEILALVNRPDFDLSEISSSNQEQRRMRAITDFFEPGSVFKIVTAAAALEENAFVEDDKIFCENGAYRVANHTLHDHQPHGTLTFRQVIEKSSNIGTVKVAQKLGPKIVYDYARRFRFGMKTDIDLPGEISGVVWPPSQWSKTSIGAIPIGHEVGVTTLQLACAISAIANQGVYMKPYIVKAIKDQTGEMIQNFFPQQQSQVVSSQTAHRLTEILVGVVDQGTGRLAQIKNVRVAGKTGTAQKITESGTYSRSQYYATFVGFAPADDPLLAMAIFFDEPRPSYFGGTVCAPVFKEIAQDVLKYLQSGSEEHDHPREN